jgi:hypothetical protein
LGERTRTRRTFCFLPVQTTLQEGEKESSERGQDHMDHGKFFKSKQHYKMEKRGGGERMRRIIGP